MEGEGQGGFVLGDEGRLGFEDGEMVFARLLGGGGPERGCGEIVGGGGGGEGDGGVSLRGGEGGEDELAVGSAAGGGDFRGDFFGEGVEAEGGDVLEARLDADGVDVFIGDGSRDADDLVGGELGE